jgi:CRP-like cAMP-binding protein
VRITRGDLQRDLEAAKAEVTRLYARWQELDEIAKIGK